MSVADGRETWSARLAFITAAVGSAVGLGNVWRFPNLSYTYGGGAFFVPFTLALIFIGIPILTLEFALGQAFRSGDVVAFSSMHKRLRGVGLGSIWCGFMVVCYYVIIIAWALTMFINSFRGSDHFPWTTYEGGPVAFFLNKVAGVGPMLNDDGSLNRSSKLVPQTWIGVTLIWLCIYLCTFKGPKLTGRITYLTMFVPLALLVFFACFFGGLDGASEGIELYIGKWDMKRLSGSEQLCAGRACIEAWPDAVAQVFFSLSITFGVMTAYSSYNPVHQGVQMDAITVALGDLLTSFIAGFVVFAGMGVLATAGGTSVDSAASGSGGLGLVFFAFPSALEELGSSPYHFSMAARKVLAALFFLMIVFLGIDSAFSLCEGFSTCIHDSRLFKGVPREGLIAMICLLGYSISMAYCNDVGLYSLDSIDYYINVCMLFVGYMECVSAGWIYYRAEQVKLVGEKAWWVAFGTMIYASVLGPRVGFGIGGQSDYAEYGTLAGVLVTVGIFCVGIFIAFRLACAHRVAASISSSPAATLYDLLVFNIESLRGDLNKVMGSGVGNVSIPLMWSLSIKFTVPYILMIMLQLKLASKTYGTYEGYHEWYQGWGIAIAFVPWVAFAVGLVAPSVYDVMMPEKEVTLSELLDATSCASDDTEGLKNDAPVAI